ncbi:MAG: hypothetical protein U9O59_01875 [Actinomycetota bacterium]|nr:hypothetical protein [Actinomycetota bacterium]
MYDLIGREYGAMLRNLRKYKDDNAYIIHFLKTKEDMKRQYDKMFYMFWIPLKDKYWLSKQEIEQLNENKK